MSDKSKFTMYDGSGSDTYLVGVSEATGKKLLHFPQNRLTWERFMDLVTATRLPKSKYDAGGVVFGKFKTSWSPSCECPGDTNKTRHRSRGSVVSRNLITMDADTPDKVSDFESRVRTSGLAGVMYSSASSTADNPRWRVVIRPTRSMLPEEYWIVTNVLMDRLGRAAFDPSTAQHERVMYLPAAPDKRSYKYHELSGALLDVDSILESTEGQAVKPRGTATTHKAATDSQVEAWMEDLSDLSRCATVDRALNQADAAFRDADPGNASRTENRHDVALRFTTRLAFLGDHGHGGVKDAFDDLGALYEQYVGDDHGVDAYAGLLPGAIGQTLVDPTPTDERMCCLTPDTESSSAVFTDPDNPAADLLTGRVTRSLGVPDKMRPWIAKSPLANEIAKQIVHDLWTDLGVDGTENCVWLRTYQGVFHEWHGPHWQAIPFLELDAMVQRVLEAGSYWASGSLKPLPVTPESIGAVTSLMRTGGVIPKALEEGGWIDCTNRRCPVGSGKNWLSFKNGLLNTATCEWLPKHESAFFNLYSLQFDYDASAECPEWDKVLEQWFPGDKKSKDALEEYLGYLVLGGAHESRQKILALLGKPRAGKGTVMRLVQAMLGPAYTTVMMEDLAGRFWAEPLLGKRVVHIAEAISVKDIDKVVSRLKAVSGEDGSLSVDRKGKEVLVTTLGCVFVITGNSEIVLPDGSGGIIDRLEGLDFLNSFAGKEDLGLQPRLHAELPGIFNRVWSAYYDRLMVNDSFTQAEGGVKMKERMRRESAPDKTWFVDSFEITKDESDWVGLQEMADHYQQEFDLTKWSDRALKAKVGAILREHGDGTRQHRSTYGGVPSRRVVLGLRWKIDPVSGETIADAVDTFAAEEDILG